MIPEIIGAVQSAKVLNDLVKAAKDLKNYNELVAAVSEVSSKLMEAQTAALMAQEKQSSLAHRVSELEKEIMDLENWEREAQRYELSEIASGVFAYKLKAGAQPPEPPHMLCQNCYSKRKKSILQLRTENDFGKWYKCHNCNSEISTYKDPGPGKNSPISSKAWT